MQSFSSNQQILFRHASRKLSLCSRKRYCKNIAKNGTAEAGGSKFLEKGFAEAAAVFAEAMRKASRKWGLTSSNLRRSFRHRSYVELLNLPSAKGANVWRSYSPSSGTKKAGRPREIGDLVHWHFMCVKRYQKKRPVCCCRRCMFMFHVGQEAWACATANCANDDMREPISRKIGHF